jgi:hypothetical protein
VSDAFVEIEAKGIAVRFDPIFGMISELRVKRDGRDVSMLHRAPWLGEKMPADAAPHLARLAGDFFCAPFGDASADGAPGHGWPANSSWSTNEIVREGAQTIARFGLDRPVMGAGLVKELRLVDDHPFLYQRHVFTGGHGDSISVANHGMLRVTHGANLSFSPKRWWETPETGLETDPARGRGLLAYPTKVTDLHRFPRADGGEADLGLYPIGKRHEDFAVGVEAPGSALGWTAVARNQDRDIYLSLRNAARLPMTMLWFSNGGRDYAPWNGRHVNVLGVEEGINRSLLGHSARQVPNPLDAAGVPTGLTLTENGTTEVRHVTGSLAWDEDGRIVDIRATEGGIAIETASGTVQTVPCDLSFLQL